jgi:hypothetical protein
MTTSEQDWESEGGARYEYGFSEDKKEIKRTVFGLPFETLEAAKHAGAKWWVDSIAYYRRPFGSQDEWEFLEGINLLEPLK